MLVAAVAMLPHGQVGASLVGAAHDGQCDGRGATPQREEASAAEGDEIWGAWRDSPESNKATHHCLVTTMCW